MMLTKFKKVLKQESNISVSSTPAVSKTIGGKNCTIQSLAGNLWISSLGTAVADNTSIKLTAGASLDLCVTGTLSLISDGSGATAQLIIWED